MKAAPKLALLFSTVFLAVCYLLLNGGIFSENLNAVSVEEPVNFSADATKDVKSILVWNNAWRHEMAVFGSGDDIFSVQGCLESRCRLYVEREALPFHQYDALVFHGYNIPWNYLPEEENFTRQPHQRYVFLTQESPAAMRFENLTHFRNYFNWTMTYRRDTDITFHFGRVKSIQQDFVNEDRVRHRKPKPAGTMVAWMVSHCSTPGRREDYVEKLREHIDVDIYGECGSLECERNEHLLSHPKCYDQLSERYLFYLAFENSLCTDYVTEKLFMILSKTNMVPVVYGAADYSTIAPPGSYIDARLFSPSRLARYLRKVAADDRLYDSFFDWRRHYVVEAGFDQMARHGFCALCQKLHRDEGIVQIYDNFEFEWDSAIQCLSTKSWNFTDDAPMKAF